MIKKVIFLLTLLVSLASTAVLAQCNVSLSPSSGVSICVGSSTTIAASLTTGSSPSYAWTSTPGSFTSTNASITVSPTVTTTYSVTATCASGSDTKTITVTVNPIPTITVNPSSLTICNGNTSTVSLSGATIYSWNNSTGITTTGSSSVFNVAPLNSTTYTITGTSNNCTASTTLNVTVNPKPTAAFTFIPNNVCAPASVQFTNNSTGMSSSNWSFGDATNNSSATNPNHKYNAPKNGGTSTYSTTLTVTNSFGCSATNTQTVSIKQRPQAALDDYDAWANGLTPFTNCISGGFVTYPLNVYNISATSSSNISNYSIDWGDGTTPFTGNSFSTSTPLGSPNPSHTYTALGTFNLVHIVSGTNGCLDTNSYSVFNGSAPSGTLGSPIPNIQQLCIPSTISWPVNGATNNVSGTILVVVYNDGSKRDTFNYPFPNQVTHTFTKNSCGPFVVSTGAQTYNNAFGVSYYFANPCSYIGGSVPPTGSYGPFYLSSPPIPGYKRSDTVICTNTTLTLTDTSKVGVWVSNNGCNTTTVHAWRIRPGSGWSIPSGQNLGNIPPNLANQGSAILTPTFIRPGSYKITDYVKSLGQGPCSSILDTIAYSICVDTIITPNFTVSANSGCAPFDVSTSNTTSPTTSCKPIIYNWSVSYTPNAPCGTTSAWTFTNGSTASSTNPSFQFTNAGSYVITLSASNKCGTFTVSKTITVKEKPIVNINTISNTCQQSISINPTLSLTNCGVNALSYAWTFTGGSPTTSNSATPSVVYSGASTKTFSVTVSNECGSASATTSFIIYPAVSVNAGADLTICNGQSSILSAVASGGTTPYTYSWSSTPIGFSSTSASPSVSPSTSTTYSVLVTDAHNCTATDPLIVNVNPLPPVVVNSPSICFGLSASLTASGANTYSWSSGATPNNASTVTVTPNTTSTYTVTGTNTATGCTNTATATVTVNPLPNVNITPAASTICAGANVSLTANGANSYSWSSTPGSLSSTTANVLVTPSTTTTYSVVGTNTATSCYKTVSAVVTVNPLPNVSVNSGTICAGANLLLSATGANTYTWSPASFLSPTSGANVTATPSSTITYTVTGTDINNCQKIATAVVTVNPLPVVAASALPTSICLGNTSTLTATGANTYTWTANPTLSTTTGSPVIASPTSTTTYTVSGTNTSTNCTNTSNVTVTVWPLPAITNPPATQTICSGMNSALVSFISSLPGTVFNWSMTGTTAITGYQASGVGNIPAMNLVNNTQLPETLTYTITPITSSNSCTGASITFQIIVKPTPIATAPTAQLICSNSSTSVVNLQSSVAGTSFSWSTSGNAQITGYAASMSGTTSSIPALTLVNSTSSAQNLTYSITPSLNACTGATVNYVITVSAVPTVTFSIGSQVVCNGTASLPVTLGSGTPNTSFAWNASFTAGTLSGVTASGTNTIPVQTIINNTTAPQVVNYNATATTISPVAGCVGPLASYGIVVNPTPNVVATPSSASICSGASTNIALSSSTSGTTFAWTVAPVLGITGATSGIGTTIAQTLFNTTANPLTVNYTVTPTFTNGSKSCAGSPITVAITVNPLPSVSFSPAPQTICSGSSTALVNLSSLTTGASFSWTGSGAAGLQGTLASGNTSSIPSHVLLNPGLSNLTASYVLQATANGCTGAQVNYVITVKPLPIASSTPSLQTICSGTSFATISFSSTIAPAIYSWSRIKLGATIGGSAASGNGNIPGITLTNSGLVNDSVIYAVVPTVNGCAGLAIRDTIIVKPLPVAVAPTAQSLCSNGNSNAVNLQSNIVGTNFSWSTTGNALLSGYSSNTSGTSTMIPSMTLVNNGTSTQNLVYTITPSINGCNGAPVSLTIAVSATPGVSFSPAPQTVCSGATSLPVTLSSPVPNTTLSWTMTVPAGITPTGLATSGGATIPAQTFINTTNAPIAVVYQSSSSTAG
ncbi:MAG: PKD domain-containing protein, partial [Chitinophagales bacterium]|nr:PKD domain-containing protein [Chitinophagales bacterium]